MQMTKLRVKVMKTLHQAGDEHNQYKESMVSFST